MPIYWIARAGQQVAQAASTPAAIQAEYNLLAAINAAGAVIMAGIAYFWQENEPWLDGTWISIEVCRPDGAVKNWWWTWTEWFDGGGSSEDPIYQ